MFILLHRESFAKDGNFSLHTGDEKSKAATCKFNLRHFLRPSCYS